jgi:hypothetical protein
VLKINRVCAKRVCAKSLQHASRTNSQQKKTATSGDSWQQEQTVQCFFLMIGRRLMMDTLQVALVVGCAGLPLVSACSAIEENTPKNFSVDGFNRSNAAVAPSVSSSPTTISCSSIPAGCATGPTFSKDIAPLVAGPAWGCSIPGCHGEREGSLNLKGAQSTWYSAFNSATFSAISGFTATAPTTKANYLNPCNTEPTNSPMYCNIFGCNGDKDGTAMPYATGEVKGHPATEGKTIVENWIKCGSPP